MTSAARPGPEGRLRTYLGIAPGVGKTYAMLRDARAQQRAGVDAVVAYWERHGRAATAGFPRPALPVADRGGVPDDMKSRFHGASA